MTGVQSLKTKQLTGGGKSELLLRYYNNYYYSRFSIAKNMWSSITIIIKHTQTTQRKDRQSSFILNQRLQGSSKIKQFFQQEAWFN